MQVRHVVIALFALCVFAAPALAQECATSGTIHVTAPEGVNAQLWMQTAIGAFTIIPVKNSSLWVNTGDGAAYSILVVINETSELAEATVTVRQFSGALIVGTTVPIEPGASFIYGITGCPEPS